MASMDTEERSAISLREVHRKFVISVSAVLLGMWPVRPYVKGVTTANHGKRWKAGSRGTSPASTTEAPLKLNCHCTGTGVVQVKGTVDGRPCHLTIDIRAERTFVRGDIVPQDLPLASSRMCSVTGHCVPLRGLREMLIGMDILEYK